MLFLNFVFSLIALILGFYILFVGRKVIWASLGIIAFFATANLLRVIITKQESIRELIMMRAWDLLGFALVVGLLGVALGRSKPDFAVGVIGFAAGADTALWTYNIASYFVAFVAKQSEQSIIIVALGLMLIGGVLGVWLVRRMRDEAMILITMLVGVQIINGALSLSPSSSWTAILITTLALAGVLVQYAGYLRDVKASKKTIEPDPYSIAYFQDLELDR